MKSLTIDLAAVLLLCIFSNIPVVQTAKLVIPGSVIEGMGHVQVLTAVSGELRRRGHHVALLSGSEKCNKKFASANASQIISYRSPLATTDADIYKQLAAVNFSDYQPMEQLDMFLDMNRGLAADCRAILEDNDFLELLKAEQFDLLIADALSPCDTFIAHLLGIPWIAVTAIRQQICVSKSVYRIPAGHSYVPRLGFDMFTEKMTFIQRAANVLFSWVYDYKFLSILAQDFIDIKRDFDIAPDMDIWKLSRTAEIWLSSTHWTLDYLHPGLPNWVPVGGLGVRPPNPLPKDLEDFVEGSGDDGFIVFSLGSIIKWLPDAPETRIIATVLSRLPQRVLWKNDGPTPPNIGSNVKLMKWLPQNDLLGHRKARLYIGHGGLNGVYEAITHAVPMVLMPLMQNEQKENAARVQYKGMGIHLDRSKLTEEIFQKAVTSVLNDPKYKKKVTHSSAILRDGRPLETAIYWIEHVLKFGGAHLRPAVYELSDIQYNLIDVALFFLAIATGFSIITFYLCRLFFQISSRKFKKLTKID